MRDYQRKKGNSYILPRDVYRTTLWMIRGYHRMKDEAEAIMVASPAPPDGQPRGDNAGDETAAKAIRREKLLERIRAIDEALEVVPPEYRRGVWNSVQYFEAYPLDADRSTYARHKARFVWEVANKLGIY